MAELSPIDLLRMRLEAAGQYLTPEQIAANKATTANDLASVTPVLGNAMSAESAAQNYADMAKADNWWDAAKSGAFGALDTAGAVTGLPWGKAARQAAKGGSSRASMFVPVEEDDVANTARLMREKGAKNADVHKETGLVFGPDGTMREFVPNKKLDIDWSYKPGDVTTVGAMFNHPELFKREPWIQNRVVKVTDAVEQKPGQMPRGVSRTDPTTGDFLFSTMGGDPYADAAKLLQYDVNDRYGFSPAGRHGLQNNLADMNAAQLGAMGADAPLHMKRAYADSLDKVKRDVVEGGIARGDRYPHMDKQIGARTAGSTDAKVVRASTTHDIGYPYAQNSPWLKGGWSMPSFGEMLVLPPKGMTPEDWAQFIPDWYRYGSGKGD